VESLIALRVFNEQFFKSTYPYALVIDSRDLRQIDVGVLSKYPIIDVRSHADDKKGDNEYIFSQDCLEARLDAPNQRVQRSDHHPLWIQINTNIDGQKLNQIVQG